MSEFSKGDRVVIEFSPVWNVLFNPKKVFNGNIGKIKDKFEYAGCLFYRVYNPEWEFDVNVKASLLTKF